MGHPEFGAEPQAAVGRGHGAGVHPLARGGVVAGFVAVIGSYSREAASGAQRRGDRGVGVAPRTIKGAAGRIACVMGMMMMPVMLMMSGFSGGFMDAPPHNE